MCCHARLLLLVCLFVASVASPAGGEEFELRDSLLESQAGNAVATQLIKQYLDKVAVIEKRAEEQKAAARKELLEQLEATPVTNAIRLEGLIGIAVKEGDPSSIGYHYLAGKVFPRELIWDRFHEDRDDGRHFPNLSITLEGFVDVPEEMTVKVWHAAGGVNGDHGQLFVGDQLFGKVGDDIAKSEIYIVRMPAGVHPVRWVLTGGTFQNNFLLFEDPRTQKALEVFHHADQSAQARAADRTIIRVAVEREQWSKLTQGKEWPWRVVEMGK